MLMLPPSLHSLQSVCCRVTEILGVFLCTRNAEDTPGPPNISGSMWPNLVKVLLTQVSVHYRQQPPPLPYQISGLTVLELWINLSDLNDGWNLNELGRNQSGKHLQWAGRLKQTSIEQPRVANICHNLKMFKHNTTNKLSAFPLNKTIDFSLLLFNLY